MTGITFAFIERLLRKKISISLRLYNS
jgi:hypothetical protein